MEEDNVFNKSSLDYIGEFNEGGVVSDWLKPQQKEKRLMSEQLFMDLVEPIAKMQGLKAAGINPLTAASEISKSPSSLPQPASSTNPIGDIAGAIGAVAGGVQSLAASRGIVEKLPHEIEGIKATAAKDFAEAGLDNATTQGVLTDNTYKDADWKATLNVKRQQFNNMKAEYRNILKTHELLTEQVNQVISQTQLNGSLKDYHDSLKLKVDEDRRWLKELNDFRIDNKLFISDSGIDGYFYSQILSDGDLGAIDKFIDIYSKYRGSVESAVSTAHFESELNSAYQRALAYSKGDFSGNPYNRVIQESADMVDRLGADIVEVNNLISGYDQAFKDGKIDKDDYLDIVNDLKSKRSEMEKSMDEINNFLDKQRSSFGYRSWLQDVSQDAISRGLGAYMYKSGSSPNPIRGFSR